MLKRIAHIVLVILLFVVTTGMTVSLHYCSGELRDFAIQSEAQQCCELPDDCGCCHDEAFTVKVKDDFSVSLYTFDFTAFEFVLPLQIEGVQEDFSEPSYKYVFRNIFPPPKIQTRLSSLQVYRL